MDAKLIEVVKKLKALDVVGNNFVNSLPIPFNVGIVDNPYSSSLYLSMRLLMDAVFGDQSEEIHWFLTEYKPGNKEPQIWLADGTGIIIETEAQYYRYLAKYC